MLILGSLRSLKKKLRQVRVLYLNHEKIPDISFYWFERKKRKWKSEILFFFFLEFSSFFSLFHLFDAIYPTAFYKYLCVHFPSVEWWCIFVWKTGSLLSTCVKRTSIHTRTQTRKKKKLPILVWPTMILLHKMCVNGCTILPFFFIPRIILFISFLSKIVSCHEKQEKTKKGIRVSQFFLVSCYTFQSRVYNNN